MVWSFNPTYRIFVAYQTTFNMFTLANTLKGKKVKVTKLIKSEISSKLLEMGLYDGQEVEVLFKAPFGDPIAVNIGGYVLSLRLDEAKLVEVH